MIYLDNGATSYPKPPEVIETLLDVTENYCANPGRAGHFMAARTAQEIYKTRLAVARLFNIEDAGQVIFTKNCTEALNLGLKGILRPGDHVITTSMEHNSVMRPLHRLEREGVRLSIVNCSSEGRLDPADIKKEIRRNTRLIVVTAASNVTGTKMPLAETGRLAVRHGILFMVDGAQGAGHMHIDVKEQHIDLLAAPGHKGLLGPQGTGFLYRRKGIELSTMIEGGTGSRSGELEQPADFPEGYEAGTVNAPGIIALGAAARVVNKIGIDVIEEHERRLTEKLQLALAEIPGVRIYGPQDTHERTAVVAMNIEGMDCEEVAELLSSRHGIAVRAGFHCSGAAHKTIGTEQTGCVRFCPGLYTTDGDIAEAAAAVRQIARGAGSGK